MSLIADESCDKSSSPSDCEWIRNYMIRGAKICHQHHHSKLSAAASDLPDYSDEEIQAAKETRKVIIEDGTTELKAVYMAGEIIATTECAEVLAKKDQQIAELTNRLDECMAMNTDLIMKYEVNKTDNP